MYYVVTKCFVFSLTYIEKQFVIYFYVYVLEPYSFANHFPEPITNASARSLWSRPLANAISH